MILPINFSRASVDKKVPKKNSGQLTPVINYLFKPENKYLGNFCAQRTPWGGWKKEGGRKTSRMTSLPKKVLDPPRTVRFPIFSGAVALFFLYKITTEQTRSSFEGVQNFSGGRVLWYVFLPLRFAPHIMAQSAAVKNWVYQAGPGSVWFGYGLGMERFERFRFSFPAVPLRRGVFLCFSTVSQGGRFRFRFLENGSGGSGSAFGSCENGSGFRFRFGS